MRQINPQNHDGTIRGMGPKGALAHSRTTLDAPRDSIKGEGHHHAPVFFLFFTGQHYSFRSETCIIMLTYMYRMHYNASTFREVRA